MHWEKGCVWRTTTTVASATSVHMVRGCVPKGRSVLCEMWTMKRAMLCIGTPHICQRLNQFGHGKGTVYGGCSEYTIIPARYAYLLRSDIDDSRAAILERE